jgi:protein-tyrosine phosphatase
MAEGILRQKLKKYKLNHEVTSCGTIDYHIGQMPDHRGIASLKKYDIDISAHRGQQFDSSDFDSSDLIFAMDQNNFNDLTKMARHQKDKDKLHLIMNEVYPGQNREVPDPYYGTMESFESTYRLLDEACEALAKRLI